MVILFELVWLKRDIRLHDHAEIHHATQSGLPVLVLYVFEPSIWGHGDLSKRHEQFIRECLHEIESDAIKIPILYSTLEIIETLHTIQNHLGDFQLHAHTEHGITHTHERDKAVRKWMRQNQLAFHEYASCAIMRQAQKPTQSQFISHWEEFMNQPQYPKPSHIHAITLNHHIISSAHFYTSIQDVSEQCFIGSR